MTTFWGVKQHSYAACDAAQLVYINSQILKFVLPCVWTLDLIFFSLIIRYKVQWNGFSFLTSRVGYVSKIRKKLFSGGNWSVTEQLELTVKRCLYSDMPLWCTLHYVYWTVYWKKEKSHGINKDKKLPPLSVLFRILVKTFRDVIV